MSDFTNFRAVFDELTDDVMRARYQFFAEHLQNWFVTLDETPLVKVIVERLQNGLDVQEFLKKSHATQGGMVGSAQLLWPEDRLQRLGMKLLVFREIAQRRIEAWNFGHDFMYAGSKLDANVRAADRSLIRLAARRVSEPGHRSPPARTSASEPRRVSVFDLPSPCGQNIGLRLLSLRSRI
jgi:hypothetical protein